MAPIKKPKNTLEGENSASLLELFANLCFFKDINGIEKD
tara:strand:- start:5 stop:121 length:117 start_codon:yes stop_codon:yes gene_type:complete